MKRLSDITAVESNASYQEKLLEKFVQDNLPSRLKVESKMDGWGNFSQLYKEIESCAAEAPVNGTIEIFIEIKDRFVLRKFSVPAMSRFFVLCTRDGINDYRITSSSSLS